MIQYLCEDSRKSILLILSIFFTLIMINSYNTAFAASTEEARVAKLIEGAKKEGKLVVYSTMSLSHISIMLNKFKEKYPFIETGLYRAESSKLVNRMVAEAKAKRYEADAIQPSGFQLELFRQAGLSMSYVSPESQVYQESFKDPDGHWTCIYILPYVMGYNTKLLSRKDIPDTYEGFLHPRWKGKKIGFDTQEVEWFANMMKIMGKDKGLEFMKKFAAQELTYRAGHTLIGDLVIAGEFPVGTVYSQGVEERKKVGAPIEWVGVAPVIAKFGTTGVAANAPHPNAARLFNDFSLSKEGQMLIKSFGRVPARSDVTVEYMKKLEGIKLYVSDLTLSLEYAKYQKQFNDIFKFH